MTYARARLWLGISGVGFFVVVSAGALWLDLPRRLLAGRPGVEALALTLAAFVLLSFPFDLLGGSVLPRRYGRTEASFGLWLRSWLRGVVAQALLMGLCGLVLLAAGRRGGVLLALLALVLLMGGLLMGQLAVARLVGGLRASGLPVGLQASAAVLAPAEGAPQGRGQKRPEVVLYGSTDPAFVGGLAGLPGSERLVLPARWLEVLPADVVEMQITRRMGALLSGARMRGVALALGWNLAGFALASQMPRADLTQAAGLVDTALWFTLWSFVGLLLLPTLNRPGVLEADRFALEHGVALEVLERGMVELDRLQDDEPRRSRWVERVFHPIPSVERRMDALGGRGGEVGAWQGARMTLYLSWAGMSLLARAVHCNVGRPELWVLFPGD